ncbi:MAG: hypothetical protein RL748_4275 [Pseudomonadota bacterium]|jgi:hypothetical protein
MNMKICYASIVNGSIVLPEEVLEVLPQDIPLYMRTDPEKGTVTICAKDPAMLPNQQYFDAMAEKMKDVDWRTYYDDGPIPSELLGKQKDDDQGNDRL